MLRRIRHFKSSEQGRAALMFAMLQAGFWTSISVQNYFTIQMRTAGLSVSAIGIANACFSATAIFATSFWGMASDRAGSIKRMVIIQLAAVCLISPLIPPLKGVYLGSIPVMVVVMAMLISVRNPSSVLIDNWTVRGSHENGVNYGVVRSMGSLGFALTGMTLSFILPYIDIGWTFYLAPMFFIPVIFLCRRINIGDGTRRTAQKSEGAPSLVSLFKNYYYVAYMLFYAALNFALTNNYLFMPFALEQTGAEMSRIGLVTGYRALLEMPMLLLLVPLRRRFSLPVMLVCSAGLFAVESLLIGVASALWQFVLFTTCFGLANGLLIASGSNYVYTLAPEGLKATAQTIVISVASVTGIAGNIFGGFMVERIGVGAFFLTIGVIMASITVLYALSFVVADKLLKLPRPRVDT